MKFLIFNGSLKPDEESNTFSVCKMLQLAFDKLGHECDIVTLRDLDYEGSTDDVNDELKPHIMKMFDVDGVIFATPCLTWLCTSVGIEPRRTLGVDPSPNKARQTRSIACAEQ